MRSRGPGHHRECSQQQQQQQQQQPQPSIGDDMRAAVAGCLLAIAGSIALGGPAASDASVTASVTANVAHSPRVKPVVIDDSGGGSVYDFIYFYEALKRSHVPVHLRGICISACGFVLMLPPSQVCVEPTASIGFHFASDPDNSGKQTVDPGITVALINRYYPKAIRKWLRTRKLGSRPIYLTAAELVAMGVFPACH
jgi:UPF0716 family protein affecting phage T7 exclusion